MNYVTSCGISITPLSHHSELTLLSSQVRSIFLRNSICQKNNNFVPIYLQFYTIGLYIPLSKGYIMIKCSPRETNLQIFEWGCEYNKGKKA